MERGVSIRLIKVAERGLVVTLEKGSGREGEKEIVCVRELLKQNTPHAFMSTDRIYYSVRFCYCWNLSALV